MRRLSLSSLALLSLLGLAGCGDEEPIEPLADFRYTIGCGGRSGCFSKDRDINGFNNEGGVTVSCTAGSSAMGSTLAFRLSALDPVDMRTRFSIALSNVIWNESTGLPVGTSGQVTVTEGGNTYVGTVSGGTPMTFALRQSGAAFNTAFSGSSGGVCRPNYILLLTDGDPNGGSLRTSER